MPKHLTEHAVTLRTRYVSLGHLWYRWQTDEQDARVRLEAILGLPVPAEGRAMKVMHWEALLNTVRELFELGAASPTWLMDVDHRGWLSRSSVDELVAQAQGPKASLIRAGWSQQRVLDEVQADIARLLHEGATEEARALAKAARAFLRRWALTIPEVVPERTLAAVTPMHRDAYSEEWRVARTDLLKAVRQAKVALSP